MCRTVKRLQKVDRHTSLVSQRAPMTSHLALCLPRSCVPLAAVVMVCTDLQTGGGNMRAGGGTVCYDADHEDDGDDDEDDDEDGEDKGSEVRWFACSWAFYLEC